VSLTRVGQLLSRLRLSDSKRPNGKVSPPAAGLYHYHVQGEGESSRVHLRVDPDRRGILLVNASKVLHLNETAVFMAYLALQKVSETRRLNLSAMFAISGPARLDYTQFQIDRRAGPS
jgi:hypothetical protein